MSRVTRREVRYDDDLAALGQMRSYTTDWAVTDHGIRPVYREQVTKFDPANYDKTPWWTRSKPRRRKKS
jgi:hypothetical protein